MAGNEDNVNKPQSKPSDDKHSALPVNSDQTIDIPELPDFETVAALADTPTSSVFKARRSIESDAVALKIFDAEISRDETFRKKLGRRAEQAFFLEHRGLARSLGCEQIDERIILVSEFVLGDSLAQILSKKIRFPILRAVAVIKSCAETLRYCAERGMTHGRLNPADIILDEQDSSKLGRPRLVGVGLGEQPAGWVPSNLPDKYIKRKSFSPLAYSATEVLPPKIFPELLEKRRAVDLFSLGAIFYHLLTGVPPFKGKTSDEIRNEREAIKPQPVRWPRDAETQIPKELQIITQKLMADDPKDRGDYTGLINSLNVFENEKVDAGRSNAAEKRKSSRKFKAKDPVSFKRAIPEDSRDKSPQETAGWGIIIFAAGLLLVVLLIAGVGLRALFEGSELPKEPAQQSSPSPWLEEKLTRMEIEVRELDKENALLRAEIERIQLKDMKRKALEKSKEESQEAEEVSLNDKLFKEQLIQIRAMAAEKRYGAALSLLNTISPTLLTPVNMEKIKQERNSLEKEAGYSYFDSIMAVDASMKADDFDTARNILSNLISRIGISKWTQKAQEKLKEIDSLQNAHRQALVANQEKENEEKESQIIADAMPAIMAAAGRFQYGEAGKLLGQLQKVVKDPDSSALLAKHKNLLREEEAFFIRCRAILKEKIANDPKGHSPLQVGPPGETKFDIVDFNENGLYIVPETRRKDKPEVKEWKTIPDLEVQMVYLLEKLSDPTSPLHRFGLAVSAFHRSCLILIKGGEKTAAQNLRKMADEELIKAVKIDDKTGAKSQNFMELFAGLEQFLESGPGK